MRMRKFGSVVMFLSRGQALAPSNFVIFDPLRSLLNDLYEFLLIGGKKVSRVSRTAARKTLPRAGERKIVVRVPRWRLASPDGSGDSPFGDRMDRLL